MASIMSSSPSLVSPVKRRSTASFAVTLALHAPTESDIFPYSTSVLHSAPVGQFGAR
jgi:hypothetical protein